ncbi:MAG: hypothetical protein DME19_16105 [Verrucomicrobia bacterium]|nr:MAG: hypothetical protein DME19_16105 [Verrucomicrobiota bacterium]
MLVRFRAPSSARHHVTRTRHGDDSRAFAAASVGAWLGRSAISSGPSSPAAETRRLPRQHPNRSGLAFINAPARTAKFQVRSCLLRIDAIKRPVRRQFP